MTNIPTELLRTLIAVVDLRSFTKAAQALGVTQPAVSAQIKRLQILLGGDLFDKSAPGVTLTEKGEVVVNYARRLLSINDQILDLAARGPVIDRLRIGLPADFFLVPILAVIGEFRVKHPEFRLQVHSDYSDKLLREVRRGEYDLIVALTTEPQAPAARHSWLEEAAWGGASMDALDAADPVPIVALGESSLSRRLSVMALEQAGRRHEIVYVGNSSVGATAAASTGLGIMCCCKRTLVAAGLTICESSDKLPKAPEVMGGVYLREGMDRRAIEDLADAIAAIVQTPAGAAQSARREVA